MARAPCSGTGQPKPSVAGVGAINGSARGMLAASSASGQDRLSQLRISLSNGKVCAAVAFLTSYVSKFFSVGFLER